MIVGGNIGKNKDTPNELAYQDYEICFEKLFPYVDYFVINVSSPNTPNLRELQEKDMLLKIIETIEKKQNQFGLKKPLLLKIAPDLNENQLDEIVYVFQNSILEGLIVSNTTIDRSIIADCSSYEALGNGGLSGKPLADKTNSIISYLKSKDNSMSIIGVGGIDSRVEADKKIALGCDLIQIYSGFIYKGPQLVEELTR
jgi:dihydroorotate dehydrogenase